MEEGQLTRAIPRPSGVGDVHGVTVEIGSKFAVDFHLHLQNQIRGIWVIARELREALALEVVWVLAALERLCAPAQHEAQVTVQVTGVLPDWRCMAESGCVEGLNDV